MMETTPNFLVRPLLATDRAAYQQLLRDPRLAAVSETHSQAADLLAYWFEQDRHSPHAFAVIERRTRRYVGSILYYAHGTTDYDLGYFLAPRLWGRGVMPAAIRASQRLVARRDGYRAPLWANCLATNQRSQRVLLKLGFTPVAAPTPARRARPVPVQWYRYAAATD